MDASQFQKAIALFDAENARDPTSIEMGGVKQSRELFYAKRLTEWVERLAPDASEVLRLAARCQHICRWSIPRQSYPMDRAGYLKWRAELKKFHAEKAGELLRQAGYDDETIRKVQDLNLKKNFPKDPESQVIEDALCLVFLEDQFSEFAAKNEEGKVIDVLQKTWKKMSQAGRDRALKLSLAQHEKALIEKALQPV